MKVEAGSNKICQKAQAFQQNELEAEAVDFPGSGSKKILRARKRKETRTVTSQEELEAE